MYIVHSFEYTSSCDLQYAIHCNITPTPIKQRYNTPRTGHYEERFVGV